VKIYIEAFCDFGWLGNGIKLKYNNIHIFKNVTKIPGIIGVEHFVRNY